MTKMFLLTCAQLPEPDHDAPLLDADPKLRAYLDQRALELLHSLGTGTSLVDRVRRRVGELLAGPFPAGGDNPDELPNRPVRL